MYVCKFLPSIQQTLHAQYELNITVVPKCLMYTRSFACFNLCCSFYIPYTGCLPAFSPHILQSTFICMCETTSQLYEVHVQSRGNSLLYDRIYTILLCVFFSSVSSMCNNHFNIILFLPALFFIHFICLDSHRILCILHGTIWVYFCIEPCAICVSVGRFAGCSDYRARHTKAMGLCLMRGMCGLVGVFYL